MASGQEATAPPDATALAHDVAALRAARPALAARPRAEVLASLADVVEAWLAPQSVWMARAVAALPAATGYSPPMIRHALPALLEPLRRLPELVAAEAGGRCGPGLILHVLPGNLPGLAAVPMALSLAVGSTALLKPGRGDRAFPPLFVESIAAHDPQLADALAVHYWPGGERAREDAALAAADLVVAAGDDAAITALANRARGRFIGHGHRVSFAVVSREQAGDVAAASALAEDVATWDQRGCLSPQLCFVEGDRDDAAAFAQLLFSALAALADSLPPAELLIGERLAIRRWRDSAAWESFGGEPCVLHALADEAGGSVVLDGRPRFQPSPLGRSLRVMPVRRVADIAALIAAARPWLECAGLAAPSERWDERAAGLRAGGVHRVCRLGEMQRPPLDWRQGGRPRLADWVVHDAA